MPHRWSRRFCEGGVPVAEVEKLAGGDGSGRIQR